MQPWSFDGYSVDKYFSLFDIYVTNIGMIYYFYDKFVSPFSILYNAWTSL